MLRYALVNSRLVEDTLHLQRRLGVLALGEPAPTLGPGQAYGSVWRDAADRWHAYYTVFGERGPDDPAHCVSLIAYARSDDGRTWRKEPLGLVQEVDPQQTNVVISTQQRDALGRYLTGYGALEGFCVLDQTMTPHPAARGRFTALYIAFPADRIGGICLAHSDDGLHWTAYPDNPVIPGSHDTQNILLYDDRRGTYVCYLRPAIHAGVDRHANRKMARCQSTDLVNWSLSEVVLDTDERDAPAFDVFDEPGMRGARGRTMQFQGMTAWIDNDCYLALAWMYDVRRGSFHMELLHSDDGIRWQREALRQPLIADDLPAGFTGGQATPMASPPVLVGDEHWLYVSNQPEDHHLLATVKSTGSDARSQALRNSAQIYRLTLLRDRWVGYEAAAHEGELLTRPFAWPAGGKLTLNLTLPVGGELRVHIDDRWGRPLGDYHLNEIHPLTGPIDGVGVPVSFGPGKSVVKLPQAAGELVRLRFFLRGGTLWGWTAE